MLSLENFGFFAATLYGKTVYKGPSMKFVKYAVSLITLILISNNNALIAAEKTQPIAVCMDERLWAPFTYSAAGEASGVHAEMVRKVFSKLPFALKIKLAPWKRCLDAAKRGTADAVFSIAYSEERANYLLYPAGSDMIGDVKQSFGELNFVIVTRIDDEFDGLTTKGVAPEPIGVPRAHLAVTRNREKSRSIVVGSRYLDLFEMLKRSRVNSLVMPSRLVDLYCGLEEYQGIFKKSSQPKEVGSLHLAFSKKGSVTEAQAQTIWRKLEEIRSDSELMHTIFDDAMAASRVCLEHPGSCR